MSEESDSGAARTPVVEGQPGHHCGRYAPGHDTHWIQAKKARKEPVSTGTLERSGNHMTLITLAGDRVDLWWHDYERILAVAGDKSVEYVGRYGVLRVPTGGRLDRATFSVAELPLDRCGPKGSIRSGGNHPEGVPEGNG